MRTDNVSSPVASTAGLSDKFKDLSLVNQLFTPASGGDSFGQVFRSQVDSRQSAPPVAASERPAPRREEASSTAHGGKRLPDAEADRLNARQRADNRADKEQRADQADAKQSERSRQESAQATAARADDYRQQQTRLKADRTASETDGRAEAKPEVPRTAVREPSLETARNGEGIDAEGLQEGVAKIANPEETLPSDLTGHNEGESESELALSFEPPADESPAIELDSSEPETTGDLSEELVASVSPDDAQFSEDDLAAAEPAQNASLGQPAVLAGQAGVASPAVTAQGVAEAEPELSANGQRAGTQAMPANAKGESGLTANDEGGDGADQSADGKRATAAPVADGDELGPYKAATKPELAMIAEKLLNKPATEVVIPTPVQERLAALAKTLDKAAESLTSKVASATEAADTTKASPFQRSVESLARTQAAATKPFTGVIQTPVHSREWANEVGQRLMMMVSTKLNSAHIQLTPRDMGPIDIKVSVQQDQANVVFTSQAAPTREALEQALPRLREMLEQNGVALGEADVRDHDTRESNQRHEQGAQQGSSTASRADVGEEGDEPMVQHQPVGLVDYYA